MYSESSKSSESSDQVRLAHLWVDFRVIFMATLSPEYTVLSSRSWWIALLVLWDCVPGRQHGQGQLSFHAEVEIHVALIAVEYCQHCRQCQHVNMFNIIIILVVDTDCLNLSRFYPLV